MSNAFPLNSSALPPSIGLVYCAGALQRTTSPTRAVSTHAPKFFTAITSLLWLSRGIQHRRLGAHLGRLGHSPGRLQQSAGAATLRPILGIDPRFARFARWPRRLVRAGQATWLFWVHRKVEETC